MAKQKKVYCCSECGEETANWAGKCPSCGAWNTLVEFNLDSPSAKSASYAKSSRLTQKPKRISELDSSAEIRFTTGISELDSVLGGGAVQRDIKKGLARFDAALRFVESGRVCRRGGHDHDESAGRFAGNNFRGKF